MLASGFECPECRADGPAEILEMSGALRLRLRCLRCEHVWWEEV